MNLYFSSMLIAPEELRIHGVYRTACTPDWSWDHPGGNAAIYDLWLVSSGRGTMFIRGRAYPLVPGDCFFIRMGEPCSARHDPKHPLTVYWSFLELSGVSGTDDVLPPLHRRVRDLPFMVSLFERAIAGARADDGPATSAWLSNVLRAWEEDGRKATPVPGTHDALQWERITKLCARIHDDPGRSYRLAELARECHCTEGHFTRLFKRHTGQTPRSYIVNARIEAARSLLRMSDHKAAEIAAALGYGDLFHFSRQFKAKTGVPPSAYRRRALPA